MTKFFYLTALIFIFDLVSCNQENIKLKVVNPSWTKRNLPNGWTVYLPKSFKDSTLTGIDSQPGYIFSKTDSILLNFDSGGELVLKPDIDACDVSQQVAIAKYEIQHDAEDYGGEHSIYALRIDTIDGRVAIIRTPILKGRHKVGIQITDCKSGKLLSIYGENFSREQENLILEIFETIEFTDK